ncbi:MAG: BamA/TamA family outer membrane protein [Flavobacterium sp.]|nr:BamA/TamA family outer membrane protein [Flavobacterium sp.]
MKQIKNKYHLITGFLLLLIAYGCSNTKYLADGELLYTGATVKVEDSTISKKERKALQKQLKELPRPKPNASFLGLRPKLFFFNLAGNVKKEKGFRHWLKYKVGEPPVLFSQVDLKYNEDVLRNFSENHGYFKVTPASDSTRHGKTSTAEYTVKPGKQYKIREVIFPSDSTDLEQAIAKMQNRSLLKKGDAYNLDIIKAERDRIDDRLKNQGFYFFNPDFLKIQVDSTNADRTVALTLKVKEDTPSKSRKIYRINDVIIYPNYSIKDTVFYLSDAQQSYKNFTIIDSAKLFKPRIFDRALYMEKGDVYSRKNHNLSLNRLVNLGVFKFVKNDFVVADTLGDFLDSYYYLTPLPRKQIRLKLLAKTNSANYTGSEINVDWSNLNTFHGAELLNISVFGGIEAQVSGQNKGFNVYRIGSEVSLVWPRFIAPIKLKSSNGYVPKTKASISYEYEERSKLYSLNTFKGSFGYLWKENIRKEHQLNITDITLVSPQNVTPLYQSEIDSIPSLAKVIEKQLIFGPTYSYTYTNTMNKRKKNTIYFKGGLDVAGTIAGLATGANAKKGDTISVFNVPFSQYVKLEAEFRHFHKFGEESQLASRIIVGSGFAYGNSTSMPFIKQFFIGGTNSIRAFRARSIGPGSYKPEVAGSSFLPDQSGDLKLELNTEFRAKIYSIVKGAIFVDAGNIWLLNDDPEKPGAQFSNKFLSEIAVGTGVGLRFDFSFLVLRTDLAFPLRLPYGPKNDRWVIDDINFGSGGWRKENLVFNLAIGYPF